jgi:LuxR family transcriptional regulator, maltose regulon positive regulatory protein
MTFSVTAGAAYSELLLKTPPPRAPRHLLARSRLGLDEGQFRDVPIVLVQAPPGFGKTSLVAQWRREHLARGAAVAWFTADPLDDPKRFVNGIVLAVRVGCARPLFGRTLLESVVTQPGEMERVTGWLAEVAQTSLDLVLVIDDADRLPPASFVALTYLLRNAPPNLRVVVAARGGLDDAIADLGAYGQCVVVGSETLRFRLDETIALIRGSCGGKVDADTCARLHEVTEGWPLGLQLALAAIERGADARAAIEAISSGAGDQRVQLARGLVAKLAPEDVDFLTRIATVSQIHPDLCRALTGLDNAPDRLENLIRDTPIFVVGDDSDWCRLHTLAREAFRVRLAELPAAEQAELHGRAMHWLAAHGLLDEAARHAHAAGQREVAFDLAERCLYQAVSEGNLGVAFDWLELMPEAELARRPKVRLAGAWALALSERHGEAERLVARILEEPGVDTALRYECALIVSGAAYFADEPDRCVAQFEPWAQSPPLGEARLLQLHANRLSALALLRGDPAQARRHQQQLPRSEGGKGVGYAARCGEFFTGLSYFAEGQILLAEDMLRPALAYTEGEFGRRHPLACMIAALLAGVVYERDRIDEAAALLANRLDVLERSGTPDTALIGYRTAARVAAAQGVEHRALDLLDALHAVGVARRLPRLCIASLAERIRMHAGRFRPETCRELLVRIEAAILERDDLPQGPLWRRSVALSLEMSRANAAIASQDWRGAIAALTAADPVAEAMKLSRLRIEIMALRAYALDRNSDDGHPLMREAMNLAQTYGLVRTFVDAHPALADLARRVAEEHAAGDRSAPAAPTARMMRPPQPNAPSGPRAVPSMVLTPKEREVLELVARNLSNKEVAQAMAVGEETVKWHLKNLFGKLDAATRKHAVRRAHILGLLQGGD